MPKYIHPKKKDLSFTTINYLYNMCLLRHLKVLTLAIFSLSCTSLCTALELDSSEVRSITIYEKRLTTHETHPIPSNEQYFLQVFKSVGSPCCDLEAIEESGFHRAMISKKHNLKIKFYDGKYLVHRKKMLVSGFIKQYPDQNFGFIRKLVYAYYYAGAPSLTDKTYGNHALTCNFLPDLKLWADLMDIGDGTLLYEEMRIVVPYHINLSIEVMEEMIRTKEELVIFSIQIFNDRTGKYDVEIQPYDDESPSSSKVMSCIFSCFL